MDAWRRKSAELTKEFVALDVYDAIIRASHGNLNKFLMLHRVAGLEMLGGETDYQKELRKALDEISNGKESEYARIQTG